MFGERETLERGYDLIVATSMTDLAELKGIAPSLASTPTIVYFHENQFAYPERKARKEYQNYKLTNIYTALAADKVLFNSEYNRSTLLEGARELLTAMPDLVPEGIVESIRNRSEVLPVPLEDDCYRSGRHAQGPLRIVWNHRWEHDKAPGRFFRALYMLRDRNIPFKVSIVGQRFRDCPGEFEEAVRGLQDHLLTWGFVENERSYRSLLGSSDLVVSTALHDFQGLAVLEAVAAGCRPLVPDRVAYPEFIPEEFRYASFEGDEEREVHILCRHLEELCRDPEKSRRMNIPDLHHLSWQVLGERYKEIMEEVSSLQGLP
jgi:glycosyltransferase involved in cell wall biosynthesis